MSNLKLNFLLVMPRIVQYIGEGYVFAIGLPYISASLKHAGFNVFTLNLNHREGDVGDILQEAILKHDINIVGTGALSPQYHIVKNVVKEAKRIKSDIITVVGGGIISAEPEVALEALEYADYGVIDEGEETICELARALESGADLQKVNGLVIKQDGKYITTEARPPIVDQDAIPWPDYEGFELGKYLDLPSPSSSGLNANRLVNMLIGRSCPYKCTFCFHSLGQKYQRRSLDNFFAHLDHLIERYDVGHVSIIDELFLPKAKDVREFCERIKEYDVTWDADFSVRNIRLELLPLMKESGLNLMQFGLESADNRILENMQKGFTVEKMESILKMVHEHDIPIFGAFIFGDPAETAETAAITMKWWREHQDYLIHLTLMKPYPGTVIYKEACKKGLIKDPIQYLKDGCPQVNLSQMNDEEFAKLARDIADASDTSESMENVELLKLEAEHGRMSIAGTCPVCSTRSTWEEVKLFSINYLACDHCAQKFHIPLPVEIRQNIEDNLYKLLDEHSKVGIWGLTISAMELFKSTGAFADDRVFPIDISASKQGMDLYGKKIHDPSILDREKIPAVIVTVPFYVAQITGQIKENHPATSVILDICQLIDATEQQPERKVGT